MAEIVVIVPTYNEARNLPLLAAELWALQIPQLVVLVVDGDSPDGTGKIAEDLARERPGQIYVLHQRARLGLRRAYLAGFRWALAKDAQVIFQMDCDFSHSPEYLPEMLKIIQTADLVVGSRFVHGGKLDEHWGLGRYFLSWFANTVYARLILNLHVRDATTGFKCWRASALRRIDLDLVRSNGYSFQFEMAYLAERYRLKVVELPIHFEDRLSGGSRLPLSAWLEAVWRPWEILWRYRDLKSRIQGGNRNSRPNDA
jgi:dolichol-phosphate mannosyltransferase